MFAAALLAVGAYLLGGVPFGLLITRATAGIDVRDAGSGNIGATNVARVAGKRIGLLVLLLDAFKGFGAVMVARALLGPEQPWTIAAVAVAAVVGHMFTPYLRLRGGKGVATSLGVIVGLVPGVAAVGLGVYAGAFLITRISSVGSLAAAAICIPMLFVLTDEPAYRWAGAAIVVLVIARHRTNIERLLRREEKRL